VNDSLTAISFKQKQHQEGINQVEFFLGGEVCEFFDAELAFKEGGLFFHTHDRSAIRAGGGVGRVKKVAAKKSDNWDVT
jgi:hypothetical protein